MKTAQQVTEEFMQWAEQAEKKALAETDARKRGEALATVRGGRLIMSCWPTIQAELQKQNLQSYDVLAGFSLLLEFMAKTLGAHVAIVVDSPHSGAASFGTPRLPPELVSLFQAILHADEVVVERVPGLATGPFPGATQPAAKA